MSRNEHKSPQFTRRSLFLGGCTLTISTILLSRLYYLQFLQGDRFKTLSEGNRIKLHLTPPLRGVLTDRNGVPIATNEQNYRMLLQTDQSSDLSATLQAIHALVPLSETRIQEVLGKRRAGRYAPPVLLKEFLTWDEVAKIEFHSASIPGVVIEVGQMRYYPFSEVMSHVLGYVGAIAEDDLSDRELLKLPDFKVGKDGVEKKLEQDLRGVPGIKEVEVNVHGIVVRELNTKLSIPGKETRLTLDSRIQQYAYNLLQEESAACVVMDIEKGDILALVSTPSFDPNRFSKGITSVYWKELNENKKVPLLNKATAGQYPPGSSFKMVVGLAALEAGETTAERRIYCPGHFFLGNHRFNCWKPGGHGHMNLNSAIAQSCDTYFYTVAHRLGIQRIADMATQLGLGQAYNLPLIAQRGGIIPTPEWKRGRYGQSWQAGDTINASIGQGYVLTTPLQMAIMTARIANGGKQVLPRLVIPENDIAPEWPLLPVSPENMQLIQNAMSAVTNSASGTAYYRRIIDPQYAMAGKTGTSQVRRILQRGQDQATIPWEYRHHGWFVAFAPVHKPRYAAAILVEHGGAGGVAASPTRDILLLTQKLAAGDIYGPPFKEG